MRALFFRSPLFDNKIWKLRAPGAGAKFCGPVRGFHCHFGKAMKPKRTILCVDDNEQSLSIRKIMLETRGYRVVACSNGADALEAFNKGGIDLVLTDLIMPGLDGHKLIEAIKNLSPQTPAILVSGKVKIYERDLRADVFLPKGAYAPLELLERIRLLLIRKRGPKRDIPFAVISSDRAGAAAS